MENFGHWLLLWLIGENVTPRRATTKTQLGHYPSQIPRHNVSLLIKFSVHTLQVSQTDDSLDPLGVFCCHFFSTSMPNQGHKGDSFSYSFAIPLHEPKPKFCATTTRQASAYLSTLWPSLAGLLGGLLGN